MPKGKGYKKKDLSPAGHILKGAKQLMLNPIKSLKIAVKPIPKSQKQIDKEKRISKKFGEDLKNFPKNAKKLGRKIGKRMTAGLKHYE